MRDRLTSALKKNAEVQNLDALRARAHSNILDHKGRSLRISFKMALYLCPTENNGLSTLRLSG